MRSWDSSLRPLTRLGPLTRCRVRAGWRRRAVALFLLGWAIAGCGSGALTSQDLRLSARGNTLYVFARSDGVSRSLCADLGTDVALAEGRVASAEGRTLSIGRVRGCYTVRHIIVCSDGDDACIAHEERHRAEGNFHR